MESHKPLGIIRNMPEIKEIDYNLIPAVVVKLIEEKSQEFIEKDSYRINDFIKLFKLTYINGDVGYVAQRIKTYQANGEAEKITYLVDIRKGHITGYIELRLALSSAMAYFKNKPFVGYTRTYPVFQQEGLGERRLKVLNQLSIHENGLPIHSDTAISLEAQKIWQRLVRAGEAIEYMEGVNKRFCFVG